ncbi:SWIM zinc finger family protein [Catenulispora subtropica]|uniref:SWIM zinc finger family protein n=1 Tax=Catenulispora subtropica TaxID=450798 RepID=A0ABN2RHE1_9ACTN
MSARADLLALTEDALVSLTNRGLYKRAAKEVAAGTGPAVATEGDVVRGTFPDGVGCALPPGGLEAAECSCGASGACRHVVAVVLAYQASDASSASPDSDSGAAQAWSPGDFADADVEALLGKRSMASARRRLAAGYLARVHVATAEEPVPWVELPNCSVRFLVPRDLAYARSDARDDKDAIALAVWAWRTWAERAGEVGDRHFAVGGAGSAADGDTAPSEEAQTVASSDPLSSAVELAADIFLTGVANLAAGFTPRLARVRRDLDAADLRWPLLAADDLADQLAAHAERAARHRPELVADLLAELVARSRAATSAKGQPRSRVLGTDEAAEVALRRLRLTALGCRVQPVGDDVRVLVFLADPAAGVVLTLDNRCPGRPTGAGLADRRLAGSTVGVLAGGNVVTETAHRRADRRLRLAVNRVARTTVSQSGGAWDHLPPALLARDLDALAAEFDRLPPRLIRPRVDAEDVRVVEIAEVTDLGYHPGSQRLTATLHGTTAGTAHLVAEHRAVAPAALDALAEALTRTPRYISATIRRGRGGLILTPIAVVSEGKVIVPDLAAGDGTEDLTAATTPRPDPLTEAIDSALSLLAETTHRGAGHLPPTFPARLEAAAHTLTTVGLTRSAQDLRNLSETLGPDPGRGAFDAWADAAIRLITTAECR